MENQVVRKNVIFKTISQRDNEDMGVLIEDIIVETEKEEDCRLDREETQVIINTLNNEQEFNNLVSIYLDDGQIACTLSTSLIYLMKASEDKEALKELLINSLKETLDIL